MARAPPINFVLSDVTAVFGTTTYSFSGSFTFDSSTLAETNIDVTASPTNATMPVIVSSYTADGALCAGKPSTGEVCFTDTADDATVAFAAAFPLDGTANPDSLVEIPLSFEPGSADQIAPRVLTGSVVVAAVPEAPSLVLFVTALGLWLLFGRWTDRRHFE
jgi:hypothetical protein